MTLVAIVLALLLERVLSHLQHWREHALFRRHVGWAAAWLGERWIWQSGALVLLLTVPALIVVGAIQYLLADAIYGVGGFCFGLLMLLLSLGPRDLAEQVSALRRAQLEQDEAAVELLIRDLASTPGRLLEQDNPDLERRSLLNALFVQSHERVFAVLLWFIVLGPLGAVGYRVAAALPRDLAEHDAGPAALDAALRLHGVVAWLPTRIVGGLFALAGSTDDALAQRSEAVQNPARNWYAQSWKLLALMGAGALSYESGRSGPTVPASLDAAIDAALAVRMRALLILMAALALATIGGWLT